MMKMLGAMLFVSSVAMAAYQPGEWLIDRAHRQLWFWPKDGEAEAVIGGGLVRAKGLSDFTFDGFVFERCRLSAVQLRESSRVAVVASTFRDTCSWGVKTEKSFDCRVEGCDFHELGEGGVDLDGGDFRTLRPGSNAVVNCHFHHLGRTIFNYRSAIQLRGVGNRAEHNLIHHLRHAGILFWGNDHYIGWNILHDVVDNFDAGAIYSWQNSWLRRGGVIEHNLVHVSGKTPNPTTTMGIYLDDHTSDVDVRRNIVDYAAQGLHNGGGQFNRWYGNVVINAGTACSIDARDSRERLQKEVDDNAEMVDSEVWRRRYPHLRASPAVKFGEGMHPAFPIGVQPDAPEIKIWAVFRNRGDAKLVAKDCFLCTVLSYAPNKVRITGTIDLSEGCPWQTYRCVFTPEVDSPVEFRFGGSKGVPTEYRRVEIEGADVECSRGEEIFSGREGAETCLTVNLRRGVPVTLGYEARKGK